MAGVISKRVIEDIRARCDIADIIGTYFRLQRNGQNFKALCPFHKEKTPSFHVNPQRQIFHCFGCGAGGDVFRFVMQHESVDFVTAVKMLAERAGVRLELDDAPGGPAGPGKDILYKLHAELADVYHRGLLKSPAAAAARAYLERRQLPEPILKEFQIGFAPESNDTILRWALGRKYTMEQLEAGGVIGKSDRGPYDRFRNRIMFPIRDEQGRVIAFSGRTMSEESNIAKYLNSPETPLFRKSKVLYALDRARKAIVDTRRAIVCEGQIDVIRCHQAGFNTAVAAQGTAFTDEHARVMKRYADEVVLVYDSDEAGLNAAVKTARVFMQVELAVRVAAVDPGEDPDSFILKRGAEAFAAAVEAAVPIVDFQLDVMARREDITTEAGLMRTTRALLETVSATPSEVQQNEMIQRISPRLRHSYPGALKTELAGILRRSRGGAGSAAEAAPPRAEGPPKEELELAEHVVAAPELVGLVEEYLPLGLITDPMCRTVIEGAVRVAQDGSTLAEALAGEPDPDGALMRFAASVGMAPVKTGTGREYSSEQAVKMLILSVWKRDLRRRIDELDARRIPGQEDPDIQAQSVQLRGDIKQMDRWETGCEIIKLQEGQAEEAPG